MQRATWWPATTAGLLALTVLTGCGNDDNPAMTIEQKQSADAQAPKSASPEDRERFLPMLRKYHEQATWPKGYDVTPEQMWDMRAPSSGDLILDDTVAAGDVAFTNQCAWALKAIDAVKSDEDTADVRRGLLQSAKLVPQPESDSFFQEMVDELAVANLDKTQAFVTANGCHEEFE